MLSAEQNERMTRVGPGTPAGEYLRRFWHPIAISDKWDGIKTLWQCDRPVAFDGEAGTAMGWGERLGNFTGKPQRVRILGEDLVLFRDGAGRPGLIGLRCPHRGTSFEHGRVEERGIACCYHGWLFDVAGNCLEMPAEPPDSTFRDKMRHTAYPVQEMGGMLWAYMGRDDPPALPRYDVYAREDGVRTCENYGLWPANWLQICENSVDQYHTAILHGGAGGERRDIWGKELPQPVWEEMPLGIRARADRPGMAVKRATYYVLPSMNRLPQPWPGGKFKWPRFSANWRTPVDDRHTLVFAVCFTPDVDGKQPDLPDGVTYDVTNTIRVHREQDFVAIASQGAIMDRATERLGTSDEGVILLRKLIAQGIDDVAAGRDPKGVLREADDGVIDLSRIAYDSMLGSAAD
jgi:phenylpropionate dioxygenase-like ring-hydroxylating dioxygenase large terminal subunit